MAMANQRVDSDPKSRSIVEKYLSPIMSPRFENYKSVRSLDETRRRLQIVRSIIFGEKVSATEDSQI